MVQGTSWKAKPSSWGSPSDGSTREGRWIDGVGTREEVCAWWPMLIRMSTPPADLLVPVGVMAARLGVRPQDLRAEAEAGTIPHVRLGTRGLLFDPERVLAVLAERAREAACKAKDGADAS